MTMNSPDEFDRIISDFNQPQSPFTDPHPYGPPPANAPTTAPVKTGLTPRGKAAIGIGGAVIACGSLFGWQHYSNQQQAHDLKAQEFAIQQQQIQLEMQKELNKANTAAEQRQNVENSEQKKQIDACVKANQKLVGKQMGVTYQSIQDDCQDKYPTVTDTSMQAAGSSSDSGGGGTNQGLLIGAGVLGLVVVVGSKRLTKSNSA
ncbi:hypothetical protein ABZ784_29190 [Streptomyces tendae]|uniref:hypothetical protein n=1 Tax=Streptomyces tendae TaxID=1932 RepID=UPI0033DC16DF